MTPLTYFQRIPHLVATGVLLAFAAWSSLAQQPYPTQPVTIVVPFSPGDGTDIVARLNAQRLTAKWGQAVIVDNHSGAGGLVGADLVGKAKPEGYTLLVGKGISDRAIKAE